MLKHCAQSCRDVSRDCPVGGFPLSSRFGRSADILDEMDREAAGAGFSPLNKCTSYYSMASVTKHWTKPAAVPRPSPPKTTTIKVYAECLRPHLSYKTVVITKHTTSREVVLGLLSRFRVRHQDPRLFSLTMVVNIGNVGRRTMRLEDGACLADLMACNPWGACKFRLVAQRGSLVKIHDSEVRPDSVYKSIILSQETTVHNTIGILKNCYHTEGVEDYDLYEFCTVTRESRLLEGSEKTLEVLDSWGGHSSKVFQLKKKMQPLDSTTGVHPFKRDLVRGSIFRQSIRKKHFLGSMIDEKQADGLDLSWESLSLSHMKICRSLEDGLEDLGEDGGQSSSSSGVSSLSCSSHETLQSL
jgi:hypothetical protein